MSLARSVPSGFGRSTELMLQDVQMIFGSHSSFSARENIKMDEVCQDKPGIWGRYCKRWKTYRRTQWDVARDLSMEFCVIIFLTVKSYCPTGEEKNSPVFGMMVSWRVSEGHLRAQKIWETFIIRYKNLSLGLDAFAQGATSCGIYMYLLLFIVL